MPLPDPTPGLVISYSYLWKHQREKSLKEGTKNRPCVIVLAVEKRADDITVIVAPITHRPHSPLEEAIEIPPAVKRHLRLDNAQSWVLLGEVNQFRWPGYDIRLVQGGERYAYGFLPPGLFHRIKTGTSRLLAKRRLSISIRD